MFDVGFLNNIQYIVKYPKNYDETKKYPVIFFLHGSGSRGTDAYAIRKNDFFVVTEYLESFDFITVAPMCHEDTWFDVWESLRALALAVPDMPFCDDRRIYCIGVSMGGYAAWQLGMSLPQVFAAMVPICGGGMYWNAERLKSIAVWAFHGSDDSTVLCEESKKMVNKAQSKGCNAKLTIFEGVGHNAWDPTWKCEEMWHWLFDQRKQCQEEIKNEYSDVIKFG